MPHMLLIVEPVGQREARGIEGGKLAYQRMLAFTEDLKRGEAIECSRRGPNPTCTAARVTSKRGRCSRKQTSLATPGRRVTRAARCRCVGIDPPVLGDAVPAKPSARLTGAKQREQPPARAHNPPPEGGPA